MQNASDALKAEFRLTLERAGLHVSPEDRPDLWEQFQQAREYAKVLDRWEDAVHEIEPQGVFVPPGPDAG